MRFGISATSRIFPKNLRTRLRPVNVCAAILSLSLRRTVGSGTTLRKAAIHRDRQDRRRALMFLCDSTPRPDRYSVPPIGGYMVISRIFSRNHHLVFHFTPGPAWPEPVPIPGLSPEFWSGVAGGDPGSRPAFASLVQDFAS